MPKYRKLYTKTLESLDVNDMPDDFTRLFWTLLPLVLCREGRGVNSATWLRSKLFPLREDVSSEKVQSALDWCIAREMIVPYSVDGRDYFHVPSFHKYQGNTTKEAESDYPPPPSQVESKSRVSPELVESESVTDAVCNMQYSDADADADAEAVSVAAVAALESIEMGQIPTVIQEATNAGLTTEQIVTTCAWALEKKKDPGIVRAMFRNGEYHKSRAPGGNDDRRKYARSKVADVLS